MPNKGKSDKFLKEQKLQRMKLILEKLKEGNLCSSDLGLFVFGHKMNRAESRTLDNYLEELSGLGLIEKLKNSEVYSLTANKTIFESRDDYEIALKHSKLITKNDENSPYYQPPLALLAFFAFEEEQDIDDLHFIQHLRTGYDSIFQLMENFKQKTKSLGLKSLPQATIPRDGRPAKTFFANDDFGYTVAGKVPQIDDKDLEKLNDLKCMFVGKLADVLDRVKNGVPLAGRCDACPQRYLSIKEIR